MRQSASAPGGKVSSPHSVPRAHCDPLAPITGRPRLSYTVRTMSYVVLVHCDPSAPITGRPCPSCIVRAMSYVVLAHCHPSAPIGVPSAPSCVPSPPSCIPSSPSHLPSVRTGTSPRPFAFRPRVQEEVRARCLRSGHAWVQYKRRGATAREATMSLCFTAWNSALSSLRETTCVDMALVGC
jgi:hypothetical protein